MGQILYTLFGHEGPSTTAELSPLGDYLLTGGQDQNIVIWNTNLNEVVTEELYGIQATRVDTDIYITDKAEIKRLPEDKPKPSKKETKANTAAAQITEKTTQKKDATKPEQESPVLGNKE
jgi:WD40 repeat protein